LLPGRLDALIRLCVRSFVIRSNRRRLGPAAENSRTGFLLIFGRARKWTILELLRSQPTGAWPSNRGTFGFGNFFAQHLKLAHLPLQTVGRCDHVLKLFV
jgi:hypothetical protein